jgi:hypothetical protein
MDEFADTPAVRMRSSAPLEFTVKWRAAAWSAKPWGFRRVVTWMDSGGFD